MTAKLRDCLACRFLDHIDRIVGVDRMVGNPINALKVSAHRLSSTFQNGLVNGGLASLVYGLLISWLGSLAVCASLAEMASM